MPCNDGFPAAIETKKERGPTFSVHVRYSFPNAGTQNDQTDAKTYLTLGKVYTIQRVEVFNWSSVIELVEFPGIEFNTILFSHTLK